jgi:hypothetical protein
MNWNELHSEKRVYFQRPDSEKYSQVNGKIDVTIPGRVFLQNLTTGNFSVPKAVRHGAPCIQATTKDQVSSGRCFTDET